MKKILIGILLTFIFTNVFASKVELSDSTGMLGDNFSLEGALEIFKQSKSPEDFEKRLNEEDASINNLDLNDDGEIDYVKVIDNVEGDSHAMVLQVDVNANESQDIAVIEMEKISFDNVVIQIVGDVELYGENMYVEPISKVKNETKVIIRKKSAPATASIVVNVWAWPTVRYIYSPIYRPWISPWRWGYYPMHWKPWRPHPWRVYHKKRVHYHVHFHPVHIHRVHRAHKIYTPYRRKSAVVHKRSTKISFKNNKNGKVIKTKRTTKVGVKSKNGRVVGGKKTTKTVTTKNNKVVKKKKVKTSTKVKKGKNGIKVKKTKTKTVKKKRRR